MIIRVAFLWWLLKYFFLSNSDTSHSTKKCFLSLFLSLQSDQFELVIVWALKSIPRAYKQQKGSS